MVIFLLLLPSFEEQSLGLDRAYSLQATLPLVPHSRSLPVLLEQVLLPAILLTEDSGGFSNLDPEKVALRGNSWTWTQWTLGGFELTDPLTPGALALHLPFGMLGRVSLRNAEQPGYTFRSGVELALRPLGGPQAGIQVHSPPVGGIWPLAKPLMSAFSGSHGQDRFRPTPDERRHLTRRTQLYLLDHQQFADFSLDYGIEIEDAGRRFSAFDPLGGLLARPEEDLFAARFAAIFRSRVNVLALAEFTQRDHAGAEYGLSPHETSKRTTLAAFLGLAKHNERFGLLLKMEQRHAQDRQFVRELFDPDGEALFPFEPDGEHWAVSAQYFGAWRSFYLRTQQSLLSFTPSTFAWDQPVTAYGERYGNWSFSTAATHHLLGETVLGTTDGFGFGPWQVSWDLNLSTSHVDAGPGPWVWLADVGAKFTVRGNFGKISPALHLARTPLAPNVLLARALDPGYFNAEFSRGGPPRGGAFVSLPDQLLSPASHAAAVGLEARPGDWRLDALGVLQSWNHLLSLNTNDDRYVLSNATDHPYYLGLLLQAVNLQPRWFFSFGFAMYSATGRSPPGNGPLGNDLGLLNPYDSNSEANSLANLDGDRAFQVKSTFGWQPLDRLWLTASVRHKDGQPFYFYDATETESGYQFTPRSKRGSPRKLTRPLDGPREDFFLNADFQLRWAPRLGDLTCNAALTCANCLDMGNELAEVFWGPPNAGRSALEAQVPRTLIFSLELQ